MRAPDQQSTVELLFLISREIAGTLELRPLLLRLLTVTLQSVGGERGTIVVVDEDGEAVDSAIVYGEQPRESNTLQLRETVDRGLAGWVMRNRMPALVRDTRSDARWLRRPDDEVPPAIGKSAICVPLLARNHLCGVMTLVHPAPNALGEEQFALARAIADQAGVAVLNAFLYERLQLAHQRYRELFEDSLDPLFLTDWDGRVVEANRTAASITGYGAEKIRGMQIAELHNLRSDKTGDGFANLRGYACSYESNLHQAGGGTIPVEVRARRVTLGEGELLQWRMRDITERRELDTLRDDLAAMIYHDLRSPLANIVSSVEILGTMLPDDPASRGATEAVLAVTRNSIDRIQRMINSLLDIHRLEAGMPVAERTRVSPAELAEQSLSAAASLAESRSQTLAIEVPAGLPSVNVDEDMIRRVLINLLENASKHTPPGSQIVLGGEASADGVTLWVEDNGPGIAPEDKERIFEKYARSGSRAGAAGLGVGLAFCRLAVEAHGGRIWLESEPGQGARFCLTLPVSVAAN
jgi:PAS domain S-box-containing protein